LPCANAFLLQSPPVVKDFAWPIISRLITRLPYWGALLKFHAERPLRTSHTESPAFVTCIAKRQTNEIGPTTGYIQSVRHGSHRRSARVLLSRDSPGEIKRDFNGGIVPCETSVHRFVAVEVQKKNEIEIRQRRKQRKKPMT
jgi:hypothetical protein